MVLQAPTARQNENLPFVTVFFIRPICNSSTTGEKKMSGRKPTPDRPIDLREIELS